MDEVIEKLLVVIPELNFNWMIDFIYSTTNFLVSEPNNSRTESVASKEHFIKKSASLWISLDASIHDDAQKFCLDTMCTS